MIIQSPVAELAEVGQDNHKGLEIREKEEVMITELEISAVDARYYFETRARGLRWYNYDDLKELMDLRKTTTAVGFLPMRLVMLLAADAAEMNLAADAPEIRLAA